MRVSTRAFQITYEFYRSGNDATTGSSAIALALRQTRFAMSETLDNRATSPR